MFNMLFLLFISQIYEKIEQICAKLIVTDLWNEHFYTVLSTLELWNILGILYIFVKNISFRMFGFSNKIGNKSQYFTFEFFRNKMDCFIMNLLSIDPASKSKI